MIKKVATFLFTKETLIVFALFLLFPMIRTQLINSTYIIFDHLFLDGVIGDIYVYNYRGKLLGCEQILKWRGFYSEMSLFQKEGLYFLQYIPSLVAFIFLVKLKPTSKLLYWFLVIISCVSILSAIITTSYLFSLDFDLSTIKYGRHLISTVVFLLIGFYILFKFFEFKERMLTVFVAFPAFLIGTLLWFKYLGPKLLPVIL